MMEQQKTIAEGAGAVSVAAAMFDKFDLKGKKVYTTGAGSNPEYIINYLLEKNNIILQREKSQLAYNHIDPALRTCCSHS